MSSVSLSPDDVAGLPVDLREALRDFEEKAASIINEFVEPINTKAPPKIVYHYTDDRGLRGILEYGCLRLTNVFSLNDPSELKHGMSHAARILTGMAKNAPPHCQIFSDRFTEFAEHGLHLVAHFFTCSFSANGDELGQWRAYADDGRGYAVGFDAKALEGIHQKQGGGGPSSFPVTYNDARLRKLHSDLVNLVFPHLLSLPIGKLQPNIVAKFMEMLAARLSLHTLEVALLFKHPGYASEDEYRFMETHNIYSNPAVKYRERPYTLVRFRELGWRTQDSPCPLAEIVIGPAADKSRAPQFAEDCLAAFHRKKVRIKGSVIPYRSVR